MHINNRVIDVLKKNLERNCEITLESSLKEDLMVDSFDMLMIISALEDEFLININEEHFSNITTVNDIVVKLRENI